MTTGFHGDMIGGDRSGVAGEHRETATHPIGAAGACVRVEAAREGLEVALQICREHAKQCEPHVSRNDYHRACYNEALSCAAEILAVIEQAALAAPVSPDLPIHVACWNFSQTACPEQNNCHYPMHCTRASALAMPVSSNGAGEALQRVIDCYRDVNDPDLCGLDLAVRDAERLLAARQDRDRGEG